MKKFLLVLSLLALPALFAASTAAAEEAAYCPPPPPMCPPPPACEAPAAPVCETTPAKKYEWVDENYTVTEKRYENIDEARTRTKFRAIKVRGPDKAVYDARIAKVKPVNAKATRLARGASRRIVETWKDDREAYQEDYIQPVRTLVYAEKTKTRKVAREVVEEKIVNEGATAK